MNIIWEVIEKSQKQLKRPWNDCVTLVIIDNCTIWTDSNERQRHTKTDKQRENHVGEASKSIALQ